MKCEGECGRSFRNGETVHAIPTRIVVIRGVRETFNIVDTMLCTPCYAAKKAGVRHAPLTGLAYVGNPLR